MVNLVAATAASSTSALSLNDVIVYLNYAILDIMQAFFSVNASTGLWASASAVFRRNLFVLKQLIKNNRHCLIGVVAGTLPGRKPHSGRSRVTLLDDRAKDLWETDDGKL
jgi:hypothetical protein